jgi:hypothetical protein
MVNELQNLYFRFTHDDVSLTLEEAGSNWEKESPPALSFLSSSCTFFFIVSVKKCPSGKKGSF